jgi:hypothetical protein
MKWIHVGIGALMVTPVLSEQSRAQAGISLQIDPSVRSVGMAHATSSVFWGDEPNYWANLSTFVGSLLSFEVDCSQSRCLS